MRVLCFLVVQLCVSAMSLCYAGGHSHEFHVMVIFEKGTARHIHEVDAKNMKTTFKSIGEALGRRVDISYLENKKTSIHKIKKWCSSVGSHDIAVLYYSGGYTQDPAYNGMWPLVKIGKASIPVDELASFLHTRKTRLSLVFADCYNTYLNPAYTIRGPHGLALDRVKRKENREKMRKVWLLEKGALTICSTKQSEQAYGLIFDKTKTGAFTEALLRTITWGMHNTQKMFKLSHYADQITYHLKQFAYSKPPQSPLYTSTIVEG